jgi:predicted nucleic acid-binding protein
MYVIDTYAWLEYFTGSKMGRHLHKLLHTSDDLYTPTLVFTEVKRKFLKKIHMGECKNKDMMQRLDFIKANSLIIDLNLSIAERAADLTEGALQNRKFGLADAIILATAEKLSARLVTGDEHFKGLDNVVFIKD